MRIWITLDGEALQIQPLLEDRILLLLAASLIDVGKISASASSIHQSSDAGNIFKASKGRVWNKLKSGTTYFNPGLIKSVKDAIADVERLFSISVSGNMKTKIGRSICTITEAIQEVVTPRVVIDGFLKSGQISRDPDVEGPDYSTVMCQCYSDFSREQLDLCLHRSVDVDIAIMQRTGQLTESQMDEGHIPKIEEVNKIPRDQRPLMNQRATVITATDTVARWQEYHRRRSERTDPVLIAEQKKLAHAKKLIDKHHATEVKKALKEQEKLDEAARQANLTPEELKADKKRKREESRYKKANQTAAKRQLLMDAQQMILDAEARGIVPAMLAVDEDDTVEPGNLSDPDDSTEEDDQ